ncbi:hypothetical protein P4O66_014732, partial [Electrophorus voltai]
SKMKVLVFALVLGLTVSSVGHYQKCMAMVACEQLKLNAYIKVKCCQNKLCNTF